MPLALTASAALLLTAGGYAIACWAAPFGRCRRCSGTGQRTTWLLHRDRPCARCKGSGRRVRIGRRLHTRATRIHRNGTR